MPNKTTRPRPPRGGSRASFMNRRAWHLELVTDEWLAEQSNRVVRLPRRRLSALRHHTPVQGTNDSLPQAGLSPLSPA